MEVVNAYALQRQLQTLQAENSSIVKHLTLKDNHLQLKEQQMRAMQQRLEDLEASVASWKDKYLQQVNLNSANGSGGGGSETVGNAVDASGANGALGESSMVSGGNNAGESSLAERAQEAIERSLQSVAEQEAREVAWIEWNGSTSPPKTGDACLDAASAAREVAEANEKASTVLKKNVQMATELSENLSKSERRQLQPLLDYAVGVLHHLSSSGSPTTEERRGLEELVFHNVSEEMSKILLLHLLPALTKAGKWDRPLRCSSRTCLKPSMDFRVSSSGGRSVVSEADLSSAKKKESKLVSFSSWKKEDAKAVTSRATETLREKKGRSGDSPPAASDRASSAVPSKRVEESDTPDARQDVPEGEVEDDFSEHVFDCIEPESSSHRQTSSSSMPAAPVPLVLRSHSLRQLHPSKAVYVSKPTSGASSVSLSSGASSGQTERSQRRYTHVGYDASESVPSSPPPASADPLAAASSHPAGKKDRKVKKLVGSFKDRFHRHSRTSTSSKDLLRAQIAGLTDRESPKMDTDGPSPVSSPVLPDVSAARVLCDGCGRGPLHGTTHYRCRTCQVHDGRDYVLCTKCYRQGVHGKENATDLLERIQELVVAKCPVLESYPSLMQLLRVGVCRNNVKKFSFCLTWVADLLQCQNTKALRARQLEVSQIESKDRRELTRVLTELLRDHRRDIEMRTEWKPSEEKEVDTLKIWVKDAEVE